MMEIEIDMMYINSFSDRQLNQAISTLYFSAEGQTVFGRVIVVAIDVTWLL